MWSAPAQDAQNVPSATHCADPSPNLPNLMASGRPIFGLIVSRESSQQNLRGSAACRHHAPVHALLTGLVATCATCGGNAVPRIEAASATHCRSGTCGMASQTAFLSPWSSHARIAWTPLGVPRLMPSGFQTSVPRSTTDALFLTLVLPACNLMPASIFSSGTVVHGTGATWGTDDINGEEVLAGLHVATSESWMANLKRSGINGSPCSPPSACLIVRTPAASFPQILCGWACVARTNANNPLKHRDVMQLRHHGDPQNVICVYIYLRRNAVCGQHCGCRVRVSEPT